MKNNIECFQEMLLDFFVQNGVDVSITSISLHEASKNDADNNQNVVNQIRNHRLKKEKYTPIFMQRLKEYIFRDAYVYTEIELEREFVKNFEY